MGLVSVYHGTSADLEKIISENGLQAQREDGYVYVTMDPKVAETYSWAWTGGRLYQAKQQGITVPNHLVRDEGMIFEFKVDPSILEVDTYNLKDEPNQFKIKNNLKASQLFDCKKIDFPQLKDPDQWVFAMGYLIGVMRG
jgi:hypothetical protein